MFVVCTFHCIARACIIFDYLVRFPPPQLRRRRGWLLPEDAAAETQRANAKEAELRALAEQGKKAEKRDLKQAKQAKRRANAARATRIVRTIGRTAMVPVAVAGTIVASPFVALGAAGTLGVAAIGDKLRAKQKNSDGNQQSQRDDGPQQG